MSAQPVFEEGVVDHLGDRRPGKGVIAVFLLVTAGVLGGIGLLHSDAFWSTPDGVYALTSREVLHGSRLYHDVVAAQPPSIYLLGAGVLALSDGLTSLRSALELVQLITAALVVVAVWRLSRRPWLAVTAGVLTPLMPLTLHENALLTPEVVATPLLLGAALCTARPAPPGRPYVVLVGGGLAALAVSCKLAFLFPAIVLLVGCRARRRALAGFSLAGAALGIAAVALFGRELWRSTVTAQLQTGTYGLHELGGLWAQAAWNAAPLVITGLAGVFLGSRSRDPALLRAVIAGTVGALLLILSVAKLGSYINVLQLAEPFLLILAACGAVWLWEALASDQRWPRPAAALFAVMTALGAVQVLSLLISPSDPWLYTRPFAQSGPRRLLSAGQVHAAVAQASRCPTTAPYPGIPFVAFVAHRRVPGGQPDTFIIGVPINARFARIAAADSRICPVNAPQIGAAGDLIPAR